MKSSVLESLFNKVAGRQAIRTSAYGCFFPCQSQKRYPEVDPEPTESP